MYLLKNISKYLLKQLVPNYKYSPHFSKIHLLKTLFSRSRTTPHVYVTIGETFFSKLVLRFCQLPAREYLPKQQKQ